MCSIWNGVKRWIISYIFCVFCAWFWFFFFTLTDLFRLDAVVRMHERSSLYSTIFDIIYHKICLNTFTARWIGGHGFYFSHHFMVYGVLFWPIVCKITFGWRVVWRAKLDKCLRVLYALKPNSECVFFALLNVLICVRVLRLYNVHISAQFSKQLSAH